MKSDTPGADTGAKPRPGKGRLWLMRMAAALLVPALLLGAMEATLRVMGYGYPTGFFQPATVDGTAYLYTNHKFTWQFFPPALARSQVPQRILATKPAGTFRIFVFGESAANGDPDPAYGFGRHLENLLEERFAGTDFEVVCTAVTAINSHTILPIARECARLDGDLWIVYMGNNEMVGPYGAGTIFGSKAPPLAAVRLMLAIKRTRLGQLASNLIEQAGNNSASPEAWAGIDMFSGNLLRPDDPGRRRVYGNFRDNLKDILDAGRRAGVPVLLSTVASNTRDCAPFASLHGAGLSAAQLGDWKSIYNQGRILEASESYSEALEHYRQAAAIDPAHAELQFRIGRCLAMAGNWQEAKPAFELARDTDALVVRADSRINRIIREVAGTHADQKVKLVDTVELLDAQSPNGLPGRELFYEHVHFTLAGNYQLARIFADRVADSLPAATRLADRGDWASLGTCLRKLAVTLWDSNRLWTDIYNRLSVPPYSARATNSANLAYCESQAKAVSARMNPRMDLQIYELALAARQDDYHLHNRFGHFLQESELLPDAIQQFKWICDTFPDFEGGHQDLGIALFLAGRDSEAEASFRRVLEINPAYEKASQALELISKQSTPK